MARLDGRPTHAIVDAALTAYSADCRRFENTIVSRLWFALECRISRSDRFAANSGLLVVRAARELVFAWRKNRSERRDIARG